MKLGIKYYVRIFKNYREKIFQHFKITREKKNFFLFSFFIFFSYIIISFDFFFSRTLLRHVTSSQVAHEDLKFFFNASYLRCRERARDDHSNLWFLRIYHLSDNIQREVTSCGQVYLALQYINFRA